MAGIDYNKLYKLQDKVLAIVFETEKIFYLTGGTCLSRFYIEKRYSDDLDLFANNESRFNLAVKNVKTVLLKKFSVNTEVDGKDFIRLKINELLQVDIVNDRVFYYGEPIVQKNGLIIDNIENILSNKITAIISRDNPKDIFDIYLISKYYSFKWNNIMKTAHKKAGFEDSDLIIRLKSFPIHLLNEIILADEEFLKNFSMDFPQIIEEIKDKKDHIIPKT